MTKKSTLTWWLPRILCVCAILFISMFALDSFEEEATVNQQMLNFMVHLIPSFILTMILVLAWDKELIGGLLFAGIGIITSPFVFMLNYHRTQSVGTSLFIIGIICFPFILVGVLFILNHLKRVRYYRSIKARRSRNLAF